MAEDKSKFKGKSREAYVGLSDQETGDYESINEAVLKSTRLSPGVYREKFRNVKKRPGDTYLEMARECCLKMDRWMKAEEVNTIEDLREVFLMEHFMYQLPPNLKYELISHEVKGLMEAGCRADSYCEAHRLSKGEYPEGNKLFFNKGDNDYKYKNNYQRNSESYYKFTQPRYNNSNFSQNYNQPPQHNYNWRSMPPKKWQGVNPYCQKDGGSRSTVKCLGCGTVGHRKFECRKSKPKPVGAVVALRNIMEFMEGVNPQIPEKQPQEEDDFKHFTISGTVKVEGSPEKKIRIFRDTGANQSLILKGALPWTGKSNTGKEAACKGEGGRFSIPLHKVWLDCGYVTGEVTVGVKETLSIDGVELFIGNDLARKRVIPNLQMVEDPVKEMMENTTLVTVPNSTGEEKLVPEVLPVCAVTRVMTRMGITEPDEVMQEDQDLGLLFAERCELENDQSNGNVEKFESQIELKIDIEIEKIELVKEQVKDESLKSLWNEAKRSDELDENFVGYYVDRGDPFKARFSGPWEIEKKVSDENYVVKTPGRRKKNQLCHVNMLKPFHERKAK
ncbi:hypothetical protein Pcinc_003183 [Petrolisthes cinctipes]|uniref:Integrase p58-like C-terminal domain-containing protein n=1 Tax=Petrolisthes cinctipes TaxID=88211 RepID=A0AAE1L1K6_PETCI|nr:hypothetical protein Pcinc_003183 [Petrolisthes cinctipes]